MIPIRWRQTGRALQARRIPRGQLLNRVTQGLYPPGSTFKIVTALEYMRERPQDYKDYHFDCDGVYEMENTRSAAITARPTVPRILSGPLPIPATALSPIWG